MWRVLLLFVLSASTQAIPVSSEESLLDLLQLGVGKVSFRVQDLYNLTCDECWRMQESMSDYCQSHGHTLGTEQNSTVEQCVDYIAPVSADTSGAKTGKCSTFERFTRELFCPQDPCTQITRSINTAPTALCNMMDCSQAAPRPFLERVVPPLSCPTYYMAFRERCVAEADRRADMGGKANPNLPPLHDTLCSTYSPHFEREGCNVVLDRVKELTATRDVCDTLTCDGPPSEAETIKYCKEAGFDAEGPVPVPEHTLYLLNINGTSGPLVPMMGVQPETATLGTSCTTDKQGRNNILQFFSTHCKNQRSCVLPHPRTSSARKALPADCPLDFELVYRCVEGGPRHSVFAPADAAYDSLTIDCSSELPKYPPLDPETRPDIFSDVIKGTFDRVYEKPRDTRE